MFQYPVRQGSRVTTHVIPLVRAHDLTDICSDRSFYMGTLGAVWATASALGPVLGGLFAQYSSWR